MTHKHTVNTHIVNTDLISALFRLWLQVLLLMPADLFCLMFLHLLFMCYMLELLKENGSKAHEFIGVYQSAIRCGFLKKFNSLTLNMSHFILKKKVIFIHLRNCIFYENAVWMFNPDYYYYYFFCWKILKTSWKHLMAKLQHVRFEQLTFAKYRMTKVEKLRRKK